MPTTPVSPERRIVLSDVNRRDLMLPRKFSDEVLDYEIDWTAITSGDPITGEIEATATGGIMVDANSTVDGITRLRLSGGSRIYAVATIDLLAITQDGERIGCRLKLPVTFRASAPGPVTRLLSGALTASGAFAGLLTNAAPGTVSLSGQVAGSGAFTGAMSVTVVRALSGALMASSSLTGSLTISEANVISLVGTIAASGGLAGGLDVYDPAAPMNVFIDSDIDTVGERDDISAMALWLGSQEHFNIVGLTASAPDSNSTEYLNCIAAYDEDRPVLLTQTPYPERFKTAAQLTALVRQGAKVDAPAKGYWEPADSGYAAPHACAQDMILAAQTYGSAEAPLWVIVQGGYTTLAQAAYEAVVLSQLPDFFQRIRVIGQPNYNSWWAPNAWNYLFGNIWPAAGTPGIFGDAWMLNGYLQWHAFNRDNGTTDTTFWNEITADSATGQHLRDTLTRPSGAFTTPHFRAGDAGAWFWLISAKLSGNFDPTNADNWCGKYRTYAGTNPWPSQTVGYGSAVQPQYPNPQGVTYSTTMFAPELTVTSEEAAYTAVNLARWYDVVRETMQRYYRLDGQTSTAYVALAGTKQPSFSMDAPDFGVEDEPITFSIERIGVTPGSTITANLSDSTQVSLLPGTNPTTFDRTIADPGTYTLTINSVSAGLIGKASDSVSVTAQDTGGPIQDRPFILFDYNFKGGPQVLTDLSPAARNGYNGRTTGTDSTDGTFNAATGLYISTTFAATVPYDPAFNTNKIHAFIAGKMRSASAVRTILNRDPAPVGRVFQFRASTARALEFVKLGGAGAQTISTPGAVFALETWTLFELQVDGLDVVIRVNGTQVGAGTLTEAIPTDQLAQYLFGARINSSNAYVDGGVVDYVHALVANAALTTEEAEEARSYVRAQVLADYGITIP